MGGDIYMPKTGITEYNLLISCPEDVKEFIWVIEQATKYYSNYIGKVNKIRVQTKQWPRDSYSQAEDTSHNLLRKQFINDCDMAVAVFWTSFGASADSSRSETEEEIQTMIDSEKQVFLYFLEKPILPSKISPDYMKLKEFREQCTQKGLCFEVNDEKELLYNFFLDLIKYFSQETDVGKRELPMRNIPELSMEQSAWLAEDKNTMIGIFP